MVKFKLKSLESVSNDIGRMNRGTRRTVFLTVILVLCIFLMYKLHTCSDRTGSIMLPKDLHTCSDRTGSIMLPKDTYIVSKDAHVYRYDRFMPLIFIGGVPRSGTTLMRAMLDAHPDVRCGQETRIIPRILQMRQHWIRSQKESLRLEEAGVNAQVINAAIAAFCLEVIARHGEPAERLCNKDPLTLKSADYLSEIFPFAKFIFMVRDGRATVHSIISRKGELDL
ncbi:hypothetical protein M8J77_017873 [Diaphorina citri]|nr:hypothetical protein M8J77_017873 [Diaphorina citri]